MIADAMKTIADDENEVEDVITFVDGGVPQVTPVLQLPPEAAKAVVDGLAAVVRRAHAVADDPGAQQDLRQRSQKFEEGDVFLLERAYDNYEASRYVMDFYDVDAADICSRMHFHTGSRMVRIMTGPGTQLRIGSLTQFSMPDVSAAVPFALRYFQDDLPDTPPGTHRTRHNLIVPENSWVDMQIPKHVAHQFNAIGPNAVIDTIHPEESKETAREHMSDYRMMAQTIFLADELPAAESCNLIPD
ncbi:hypothetical protein QFZ53_002715 [Microbacterium natoriense]|uniref:Uncharacterized protein n=1 Tax=Microbacterium natoriense TaxID=284570 RepID=A0AAW8F070_9MICO|nr:hypothetical protein [Microbacterium natoriense]MDQ0648519.1 hypothetical protein [Microbacterium natoriense]